jgi:tagatose 6-phosphate kinase
MMDMRSNPLGSERGKARLRFGTTVDALERTRCAPMAAVTSPRTIVARRIPREGMPLIVTVTPNAALDWTFHVEALEPGARHRVQRPRSQAGGKGVNVSRVLVGLGIRVRSVVLVGGPTGARIESDLEESGLAPVTVEAAGDSRICTEIVDARNGLVTQLHGAGVCADADAGRRLADAVERACEGAHWLALCGSLAEGLPVETYAALIQRAHARGIRVALDTSGAALSAGWRAAPEILRINADEARETGLDPELRRLDPATLSIVSDGADEIAVHAAEYAYRIRPPRVRARNPIGCGDTMLAGLLSRIDACGIADALRFATALASADAEAECAGRPDLERARALETEVVIRSVGAGTS